MQHTNETAMQNPFQLSFFRVLKQLLPEDTALPEAIADILQVSQDSAYRRLRGDTAMSIDEAITLCNHYKLPISLFVDSVRGLATFRYVAPDNNSATFKKYLSLQLKTIEGILSADEKKIVYAAIDTPLFQHYGYDPLCIFKFHFWMKVILGVEDFKSGFQKSDIDKELLLIAKKIHEGYLQIPSNEIWSYNVLDTTLQQIDFYWESGYFNTTDDAIEILDTLQLLLNDIEHMAEKSTKLIGHKETQQHGAYQLYQSDILLGNNTVVTYADGKRTTFISHQTFNMLICTEEAYCTETEEWLSRILSKSNLISGVSEKSRIKFFRKLRKQIDEAKGKILIADKGMVNK
ncbi:MAG: hypothetical protein H7Y00_13650 [Fimbriimonadaceae bacterium]|nr:hypothetical protein [Chitinophagales bacterium]